MNAGVAGTEQLIRSVHRGVDRPALVLDVEMSQPLCDIDARTADGARYRQAWLVVKVFGEPVGLVPVPVHGNVVAVEQLVTAVNGDGCAASVRARVDEAGGNADAALSGAGARAVSCPAFLRAHARWRSAGPTVTVVVCTRNRPAELRRAVDSVLAQSYQRFDVVVVDNAPRDTATLQLVDQLTALDPRVRYTCQPRPGLSWARNHALSLPLNRVVAWLDDDEVADQHWLMELAAGFCTEPGAAAVSGSVVPAELETEPQLLFEQYGGHTKGRGFAPDVFHGRAVGAQSPVYPLPAFGVGANMAFDVDRLRSVGGFDTALGAGTASMGGEDTLVFSQILLDGGTVVYRPSALTRHFHRREYSALANQMRGYGVGLTAYYASLLSSDWRLVFVLLRLVPRALRDTFGAHGDRMVGVPDTFPPELLRLKTRGMLAGPLAYVRARRQARRMSGAGFSSTAPS